MQLSTTICVMLLFAHVAACTLVLAAKLEGLPDGSWMVQYGMSLLYPEYMHLRWRSNCNDHGTVSCHASRLLTRETCAATFSGTYVCVSADLIEKSSSIQYLYAMFISTSHLFCLGYGLPTMPGTLVELSVTLVSMIVGSVLFLVVVGTLPTAILEQEVSAAAQELEGDHVPLPTARYCLHSALQQSINICPSGWALFASLGPQWDSCLLQLRDCLLSLVDQHQENLQGRNMLECSCCIWFGSRLFNGMCLSAAGQHMTERGWQAW